MEKSRQSNFELLRIIAMFFIIFHHLLVHGKVFENCINPGLTLIFKILSYVVIIAVNLFILITGYFQSKSNFKQSKVWQLLNSSLFYEAIVIIIFSYFGIRKFTKLEIIRNLSILNLSEYWFIKTYLLLYILSPFLNKLVDYMDKKTYIKFLLTSTILFSILPYITGLQSFNNDGYTLYSFVFLYFIGAYFRKYPFEKNYLFKRMSKKFIKIILLILFISCVFLNFSINETANSLLGINSIIDEFANNILKLRLAYSNPFIIIQAISMFLLFSTFTFKSKVINYISKLTIGVYLIHDNGFVRSELYKFLKIDTRIITSYYFFLYFLAIALLIYVVCLTIEWLRQCIFKFIYNRKISKKIREKYYSFLRDIYIVKES